jgi:hypothetical protein
MVDFDLTFEMILTGVLKHLPKGLLGLSFFSTLAPTFDLEFAVLLRFVAWVFGQETLTVHPRRE